MDNDSNVDPLSPQQPLDAVEIKPVLINFNADHFAASGCHWQRSP
jgi:hypothetical protein